MKTKQTAIRLPDDMKAAAEKKAGTQQRSLSSYIKYLIAKDLGSAIDEAANALEKSGKANLERGKKKIKKAAGKEK